MAVSIEIEFAPSRLSEEYLTSAYELTLPLVARGIEQKKQRRKTRDENYEQTRLAVKNG
jgi:hypothetical protein